MALKAMSVRRVHWRGYKSARWYKSQTSRKRRRLFKRLGEDAEGRPVIRGWAD